MVINTAKEVVVQWQKARMGKNADSHSHKANNPRTWCPPPIVQLKCNIDASLLKEKNLIGYGIVLRKQVV